METQIQVNTASRLKPGALVVGIVALAVFVLDQLTKYLVVQNVGMGNVWYPLPALEIFRIVGSYNTGTACGYFPQLSIVFTLAPFFILAAVIWFYRSQRKPSWLLSIAIGLIIGGALGNLADRLRLGYVVDFVQVGTFPIFNIADAAVSTAVVLMLLWSLREDSAPRNPVEVEGAPAASKNSSWKLGAVFLAVIAIVAVAGYFVCVIVPENFLR